MRHAAIQTEFALVGDFDSIDVASMLSASEMFELECIKSSVRRRTFVAGRIVAKRLLTRLVSNPIPTAISIHTRDKRGMGIRPQVEIDGRRWDGSLSISHTDEWVVAAVAAAPENTVGIDVVAVEPRPTSFVKSWFTPSEQVELSSCNEDVAACWAAKEAVFKAMNNGQSFPPHEIMVSRSSRSHWRAIWNGASVDVRITVGDGTVMALAVVSSQQARLSA